MQSIKNLLSRARATGTTQVNALRNVPGKANQTWGTIAKEDAAVKSKSEWSGPGVGRERGASTNGLLFGEPALAPGAKRVPEAWERIWVGSCVVIAAVGIIGLNSIPQSDHSVWAREEVLDLQAAWQRRRDSRAAKAATATAAAPAAAAPAAKH